MVDWSILLIKEVVWKFGQGDGGEVYGQEYVNY